jgi:hypothetical protein
MIFIERNMRAENLSNDTNNISFGTKIVFKERKRKKIRKQMTSEEIKSLNRQLNTLKQNKENNTLAIKILKGQELIQFTNSTFVLKKTIKYNIIATLTDKYGNLSSIRFNRLKANEIKPEDIYKVLKNATVNIIDTGNFFNLSQFNNTKKSVQTTLDTFC